MTRSRPQGLALHALAASALLSAACSGSTPPAIEVASGQVTVIVTPNGNGGGRVTSTPAGIDCGSSCSSRFDPGTPVTLHAAADAGSTFVGWTGGGCSGTGDCTLALAADAAVTASFGQNSSLVVTLTGAGAGAVTASDATIDCGASCAHVYPPGATVTLTANPADGSSFAGWSGGGCSGTGSCVVTVNAPTGVSADFVVNSCAGTQVGGHCWYLGGDSQSCTTVCAGHGGYSDATRTYAGSDGTDDQCRSVLGALGITFSAFYETSQGGIGCFAIATVPSGHYGYRDGQTTTADATYSLGGRLRACACQQ